MFSFHAQSLLFDEVVEFGIDSLYIWLTICPHCNPAVHGRHVYRCLMDNGTDFIEHMKSVFSPHDESALHGDMCEEVRLL